MLAFTVLALVCGVRFFNPDFPERLERMTYDQRVRIAQKYPTPVATNLAFVSMEDSSIKVIRSGNLLGRPYGLYWPRHVYGRLVEELAAQGAKTIAFDVLFGELRPDHASVQLADGGTIESDDFFAIKMRQAGNVITAFTPETIPPDLFTTNCSRTRRYFHGKGSRRCAAPRQELQFEMASRRSNLPPISWGLIWIML